MTDRGRVIFAAGMWGALLTAVLVAIGATLFSGCAVAGGASPSAISPQVPEVAVPPVSVTNDGILRRAVVFGLDHVDPNAYNGWDGECPGTILDALRMRALLIARGYTVVLLTNEQATAYRLTAACVEATKDMKAGDRFIIYGSSHGGQAPDLDGDEGPGGKDSTLCAWDGQIVDDNVGRILMRIPAGVWVAMILDCCNTGSMYKGRPPAYGRVFRARAPSGFNILCTVVYMGGCGDGKSSYGGDDGGVFTGRLLDTGPGDLAWRLWFNAASAKMPRNQIPVFAEIGLVSEGGKILAPGDVKALK